VRLEIAELAEKPYEWFLGALSVLGG